LTIKIKSIKSPDKGNFFHFINKRKYFPKKIQPLLKKEKFGCTVLASRIEPSDKLVLSKSDSIPRSLDNIRSDSVLGVSYALGNTLPAGFSSAFLRDDQV